MKLIRTNSMNKDFVELVKQLDADLAIRDGDDHSFYNQFNGIDNIKYVVVVYHKNLAVGCGAIKEYDKNTMEIKRMYTSVQSRGKGIASKILTELEKWATELSYKKCILETGIKQPEAIALYEKNGYLLIDNYGQYTGIKTSKCFQKIIK
ncbi:GNAT family N-acetyltransferase [Aquimarina gracilis]|uniref:GNAT family N-acetyltransferase n=1 Tax=Aquimarina gracilis TaxID=874422 RepID=A0ABU5ZWJ7_9FLAO|nr:GNAT family N-acetyltransferase [Aquimarina gracilis]MEB3346222.1 GNAT family N-acetyltransferase [Aquimarina gracilis]